MKNLSEYITGISEADKPCAVYVHGFNSNRNSSTFQSLKHLFPQFDWISEDFDLTNPRKCLQQIKQAVNKTKAVLLVGSSFGAFYVLHTGIPGIRRIVINPCFEPAKHVPMVDADALDSKANDYLKALADDGVSGGTIFGIFGNHDELFNYQEWFGKEFTNKHKAIVDGGHRLPESSLEKGMAEAINALFPGILNESEMLTEHYTNIFVKREGKDKALLSKYKDQVWDILYNSYKYLEGGLAGIETVDELIADSEFWKLVTKGDKVLAAFIYNFKRGGRKIQYAGCVRTPEGKKAFYDVVKEDIKLKDRETWAEVSGVVEQKYLEQGMAPIPAEVAQKILSDKQFINFDPDGYHYTRMIGRQPHTKMMVGNINV